MEKIIQRVIIKLQGEIGLSNDNINKDINNLDEHKQIFELRIELQNKMNEENEKLNTLIQNNKASVEINDLEILYTSDKNNQKSINETEILNLSNILAEKYID